MTTIPERDAPAGRRARVVLHSWPLLLAAFVTLCMLAVAVTAFAFSGAFFTSSSTSPANVVTAGTLRMSLSATNQIVDGTAMVPGETRQGNVTVTLLNGRGDLHLDATGLSGDTALAGVIDVVIIQTDPGPPDPIYDDPLTDLQDVDLGSFWAPDQGASDTPQARTYRILLVWPAAANDIAHLLQTVSFNFDWQMVSS